MLASVTGQLTSAIGNHGVYAVFVLMAIDAVFPAASEVVMLYAGALASGAFAGEQVVLFGKTIPSGFWAFVVMVLAGTLGYTVGAIGGWAIGDLRRPPATSSATAAGSTSRRRSSSRPSAGSTAGTTGPCSSAGSCRSSARSSRSRPGVFRMHLRPYTWLTLAGSTIWCLVFAGVGYALGDNYTKFDTALRYVDYLVVVVVVALVVVWLWRRRGARKNAG